MKKILLGALAVIAVVAGCTAAAHLQALQPRAIPASPPLTIPETVAIRQPTFQRGIDVAPSTYRPPLPLSAARLLCGRRRRSRLRSEPERQFPFDHLPVLHERPVLLARLRKLAYPHADRTRAVHHRCRAGWPLRVAPAAAKRGQHRELPGDLETSQPGCLVRQLPALPDALRPDGGGQQGRGVHRRRRVRQVQRVSALEPPRPCAGEGLPRSTGLFQQRHEGPVAAPPPPCPRPAHRRPPSNPPTVPARLEVLRSALARAHGPD